MSDTEKWGGQAEMLVNRVRKNARRFKAELKRDSITCYRIYDRDIPEIPLVIDRYEDRLHCAARAKKGDDDTLGEPWVEFLTGELGKALGIKRDDIFVKIRERREGGRSMEESTDSPAVFTVREGGLDFTVNLSNYLDTGLFLDHRTTRAMVRDEAKNKRFLNLFAYTGAFTVYAAKGGAKTTTTVDLSNTYLGAAKKNMEMNSFTGWNHSFVRHDIVSLLKEGGLREKFDLVVLDPPTVSTSKAMKEKLVIQRDHGWMLNAVLDSVSKGGVVYFSNNFKGFKMDDHIRAARVEEITQRTVPFDFQMRRPHRCFRIVR